MFTLNHLSNFYGSETFTWHWTRRIIFTDGIKYICDNGAAWLVDAIASHQTKSVQDRCRGFQHWKLVKHSKGSGADLICTDGNSDTPVVKQIFELAAQSFCALGNMEPGPWKRSDAA